MESHPHTLQSVTNWSTRGLRFKALNHGFSISIGVSRGHPPRDWLWSVGSARADLPNVRLLASRGIAHHLMTAARKADTNGPTGTTKCGITSARTFRSP